MLNLLTGLARHTRQHHAIEHATLHLLAQRLPHARLVGLSDPYGFTIFGDVEPSTVQRAAGDALLRLQAGERHLAIHPNCGTNFVTGGVLAGAAAGVAMLGAGRRVRSQLDRLPLAMMLATAALILAQPLGLKLQEVVTTSGEPGDLRVVEIRQQKRGKLTTHRVITAG